MASRAPTHLVNELLQHGVRNYSIQTGGRHARLVFEWNGGIATYPFSMTTRGSDRRTVLNSITALRRMMGVSRQGKATTGSPTTKRGLRLPEQR